MWSEIKNWVPLSASLLPNWSSSTRLTGIPARETQVVSYQPNKNKLTHIWQPLNLAGACCCCCLFFFFTAATTTCVVPWTPDPPVWPFRRREEAIKRLEEGEPLGRRGGERKEVDWGSVQLTVSVRSKGGGCGGGWEGPLWKKRMLLMMMMTTTMPAPQGSLSPAASEPFQ